MAKPFSEIYAEMREGTRYVLHLQQVIDGIALKKAQGKQVPTPEASVAQAPIAAIQDKAEAVSVEAQGPLLAVARVQNTK